MIEPYSSNIPEGDGMTTPPWLPSHFNPSLGLWARRAYSKLRRARHPLKCTYYFNKGYKLPEVSLSLKINSKDMGEVLRRRGFLPVFIGLPSATSL